MRSARPLAAIVLAACCFTAVFLATSDGEHVVREAIPVDAAKGGTQKVVTKPGAPAASKMPPSPTSHEEGTQMKPSDEATLKAAEAPEPASVGVQGSDTFPDLAHKYSKGVVQIEVVKAKHQWLAPEKSPSTEEVSGSGFFVDNKHLGKLADSKHLHIVTNAHVAMDAVRLTIRLPATGLLPIKVKVVGLSPPDQHDIALLQVESVTELKAALKRKLGSEELGQGLIRLPLGDSDNVRAGEKLMALGYPEGLPGVKSTLGVMSGYQEMERKLYMQMTTPINPGNSGGPLICGKGHVIGVNTAGIDGSENIGFSIPSAVLSAVLPVLAENRVFTIPMFGIVLNPTSEGQNDLFGMPESARGEYLSQVYKGSMAYNGGVRQGDVLFEIDGMPVSRRGQMFLKNINAYVTMDGYLGRRPLNSKVTFKVWRGNAAKTITMGYKLTPQLAIPNVVEGALAKQSFHIAGGLVFSPLTQNYVSSMITPVSTGGGAVVPAEHLIKYSKYPHDRKEPRVVIADVISSSLAEATKVFDAAMVVEKINKVKVRTMADLCKALKTPVKDKKNKEWVTVESEDGTFGAMPLADVTKNDDKLAKMGLFTKTKCDA